MIELGISSYAYNWAAGVPGYETPGPAMTPFDLIRAAAELKIGVVQIADNMPLDRLSTSALDDLASEARSRRIKLEIGTCGLRPERLGPFLEIARRVGARFVRTLIDTPADRPSPDEAVSMLKESAGAFMRAGVILGIENHDRFPARVLRSIVERTGSPAVGVCLDTANSLGCGEGIEAVTAILRDLIVNLHVKDFRIRRMSHQKGFLVEGSAAGDGLLNIPWLLDTLSIPGRTLTAVLELWSSPARSVAESIEVERTWTERSVAYLRQAIGGIPDNSR
jgi:sugar phosphate isomerase/epimerase